MSKLRSYSNIAIPVPIGKTFVGRASFVLSYAGKDLTEKTLENPAVENIISIFSPRKQSRAMYLIVKPGII